MKKLLLLLLLAPFFATAQQPSVEALTKEFINSIQLNNSDKYVKLFPNMQLLTEMMTAAMKDEDSAKQENMKASLASQTDSSFTEEMRAQFKNDYRKILQVIKNPASIVFTNVTVTPTQDNDEMFIKIGKGYDAIVFVTSEGKKYKLTLTEIIDYKNNFYGFNFKKIELITTAAPKKVLPKKTVKKV
jgi:hypothetical protein